MTEGRSRRRLRVRRKRKGESWAADAIAAGDGDVIAQIGCCLVEGVVSATVLAALLAVPAYLLLTRVT